jgi:hypothetical protein
MPHTVTVALVLVLLVGCHREAQPPMPHFPGSELVQQRDMRDAQDEEQADLRSAGIPHQTPRGPHGAR